MKYLSVVVDGGWGAQTCRKRKYQNKEMKLICRTIGMVKLTLCSLLSVSAGDGNIVAGHWAL